MFHIINIALYTLKPFVFTFALVGCVVMLLFLGFKINRHIVFPLHGKAQLDSTFGTRCFSLFNFPECRREYQLITIATLCETAVTSSTHTFSSVQHSVLGMPR